MNRRTNRLTHSLAAYSVRNRLVVVLLLVFISSLAVVGFVDAQFFRKLFTTDATEQVTEPEPKPPADNAARASEVARDPVNPISLSRSDSVLVVECEDFFTRDAVEALRAVTVELEALPQVSNVLWMDRVPILNIFGLPEPLLPRATASEMRFAESRSKAMRHPLVGGQLLSNDGKTLLMLVSFDFYQLLDDADATTTLKSTAEMAASKFPSVDFRFRVTGNIPTGIAALNSHESNMLKFQLIGYGMILTMALVLFRGVRAVIIVALAPLVGVAWTLGIIRFFDYSENPLVDVILPILVSLVGLTDGVHLMVQIRKLRATGHSRETAAELGLQQVGLACFLTSLTTAIGFGSLMLADSEWVRQFGMCCMVGVLLCFISVVTIIPLACSTWLGNRVHIGHDKSLIDRNLGRISGLIEWVLRYRKTMAGLAILSSAVFAATSLTLKPDQRQSNGLPESAEATQAMFHVDRAFGGLEFANVSVNWDASVPSDAPEILEVITAIDDLLSAEPLVGNPLSIRNFIDAQPGSGPPAERMSLVELLPPPLKQAYFKPDENFATVTFRVQDLGIAAYGPVFERIEAGLANLQAEHPRFALNLRGGAVWRWQNLYQIVVDLAASLGTASIIILVVLAVVFRSARLGLISVIPNLFPLAFTGAYLAWAGYNLEIVMVCSFTVCLGIAVDDTIHFLTRYLDEREKTDDIDTAIRSAFTGVGTALIMTTAVLVAGFSVVTFSDSRDHHIFATMGALTIAAALFCDLVFLPALLAVFDRPSRLPSPHAAVIEADAEELTTS